MEAPAQPEGIAPQAVQVAGPDGQAMDPNQMYYQQQQMDPNQMYYQQQPMDPNQANNQGAEVYSPNDQNIQKDNESLVKEKEEEVPEQDSLMVEIDTSFIPGLKEALKVAGLQRKKNVMDHEVLDVEAKLKEMEEKKKAEQPDVNNWNPKVTPKTAEDPIMQISAAKKAIIDQYYKMGDFIEVCPSYKRYRISWGFNNLEEEGDEAYHWFDVKETTPAFPHDLCCKNLKSLSYVINHINLTTKQSYPFLSLSKPFQFAIGYYCVCCIFAELNVKMIEGDKVIGKIDQPCDCCKETLTVHSSGGKVNYYISTGYCNPGVLCSWLCCEGFASCQFDIFGKDDIAKAKPIGKIMKKRVSGKGMKPDVEQIEVEFPEGASPKQKINLISAAFFIDYLYFQNIYRGTGCHANNDD